MTTIAAEVANRFEQLSVTDQKAFLTLIGLNDESVNIYLKSKQTSSKLPFISKATRNTHIHNADQPSLQNITDNEANETAEEFDQFLSELRQGKNLGRQDNGLFAD